MERKRSIVKKKKKNPRKTSCYLRNLRSAISMGSDRDCSTAFATYPAVPCWKSRLEAPLSKGAPSISMRRAQARAVALWSSLHFASVADLVYRPLCCLAPFWGSTSWGGGFSLPLPPYFPSPPSSSYGRQGQLGGLGRVEEGGALSGPASHGRPTPTGIPTILVGLTFALVGSFYRLVWE